MLPFDPSENVRKPFGFMMFSGGSKGNIGKKRVNFDHNTKVEHIFLKTYNYQSKPIKKSY